MRCAGVLEEDGMAHVTCRGGAASVRQVTQRQTRLVAYRTDRRRIAGLGFVPSLREAFRDRGGANPEVTMNKPSDQNTNTGPARTNDQTQPRKDAPPSFDGEPRDPRESAPDNDGNKKQDLGKTYQPGSGKGDSKGPMQAARGDDDLMSKKPGKSA